MTPPEEWRVVPGFPRYKVSNLGRVMSFARRRQGKLMVQSKPTCNKYRTVCLSKNGPVTKKVHKLVFHAFNGEFAPDSYFTCVDHIDQDKENNNLSNLRRSNRSLNTVNSGKGYSFYKPTLKWVCQIRIDGKCTHFGYFKTEEEAAAHMKPIKEANYARVESHFNELEAARIRFANSELC